MRQTRVVLICEVCDQQKGVCVCADPKVIGVLHSRMVGQVREAFYSPHLIQSMNAQPRRTP